MRDTRILMGMPITVEVIDLSVDDVFMKTVIDAVFAYFQYIDEKFSTYKDTSEISAINKGALTESEYSQDMKTVFALSEKTKKETSGYFNIVGRDGKCDPSGIVKGWAVHNAALFLREKGFTDFYIDAGGDIEVHGNAADGKAWKIGIANPFGGAAYNASKPLVKVLYVKDRGVATSGTYVRGQHIYNPHKKTDEIHDIVSVTVIGPNIYEADRFATAAFAMGKDGITFIQNLDGFEGYMIDHEGIAIATSGFERYTQVE